MSKRVFLGAKNILPQAIAKKLLEYTKSSPIDLSNIILVLPGTLAQKEVLHSLMELVPQGVITPKILTPSQLLHYNTKCKNIPSSLIEELIWAETIRIASETPQKFNLVFPNGEFPVEKHLAAGKMQSFRNEVSKGGFSIAQTAEHLGSRGSQLAMLEDIFLKKLNEYGYSDSLQIDREAITDNEIFAGLQEKGKIIIAGIPDLPNMLRQKLEQIDLNYPNLVELWLHADKSNEADFDCWGTPIPENWSDKYIDINESSLINAFNPEDAAKISAAIVTQNRNFNPDEYSIVLGNPSLFNAFVREFSKFTTPDGKFLQLIDPSGMPFGRLRLYSAGQLLINFLKSDNDFLDASQLLREKDFLDRICAGETSSSNFLTVLDDFFLSYMPDNFDAVLTLCEKRNISPILKKAFAELDYWKKTFLQETPANFIRSYFTWLYEKNPAAENEITGKIPFSLEIDFLKKHLEELDSIPQNLIDKSGKLKVLETFWRNLSKKTISEPTEKYFFTVEGCLEIPFLNKQKVIFCGVNDSWFPDKIDISPFLTDTIRQNIGLRSNIETRLRALCHMQSLISPREPGNVHLLSLRRDCEKNLLRPSTLLFAGNLPENTLFQRCKALFCDPGIHVENTPKNSGDKIFRLKPEFSLPTFENDFSTPILPVTFFDDYLSSPFGAFLSRFHGFAPENYSALEPDARVSGILYHKIFEALGTDIFKTAEELKNTLMHHLDRVLFDQFGPELPAFVVLQKENMRQRLGYAAPLLFDEQQQGFQVLTVEYSFGANNQNNLPLSGAVFRGKIDRIEYNKSRHLLRIIDIKTGKTNSVSGDHYEVKNKSGSTLDESIVFKKLQLPLYALLLQNDESFFQRFPHCREAEIECGYLSLPQSVTDIAMQIWEREDFYRILPLALLKTKEIIEEVKKSGKQIIFENPEKFANSKFKSIAGYFLPDLLNATTDILWNYPDRSLETVQHINHDEPTEKIFFADYAPTIPAPQEDIIAKLDRCCNCPADIRRKCSCDKVSCSFNGFKSFNIITASAGTGKTYRLASRFIQLMHFGADPEEIMAVTFTRKAAGEIFDKIIARLLEMAYADPKSPNCCTQITRQESFRIIRKLLCSSKDLPISTFDSFFMKLLQAYAPEFGIWGEINMIDPDDDRLIRKSIRKWIKSFSGTPLQDTMRELLKDANSAELKNFADSIISLLDKVYNYYLLKVEKTPSLEMPQLAYHPWKPQADDIILPEKLDGICQKLYEYADLLEIDQNSNKSKTKHARELTALADFLPKTQWQFGKIPDSVNSLFATLHKYNSNFWLDENTPKNFTQKLSDPPEISRLLCKSFRHIRALEYLRLRRKTAAVFELMKLFDQLYSANVRAAGNLTFTDLSYLLFSMDPDTRETILGTHDRSLEMRLDAKINHYLFDEFQDTNNLQYLAFDGMLKEMFSTVSENFRSFFCVGDKKQSIYQWRDGNPYLFDYLINQITPVAVECGYSPVDSLSKSYRSNQTVLDMVNILFYPEYNGVVPFFEHARKQMDFKWHTSSKNPNGFAAFIDQESDTVESKARVIFEILKKQKPLQKNLTVGVLVRKNRTARELADAFSSLAEKENLKHILPVSVEGSISSCDSMAFNLYRSLITLALHPSDKISKSFLEMLTFSEKNSIAPEKLTPQELLRRMKFPETGELSEEIRKDLSFNGIAGNIDRFINAFAGEWNDFDSKRMSTMRDIAENFNGTPEEFLEALEWIKAEDAALKQTVQIMTIHKSKGLEFDIVFLPDTANSKGQNNTLIPDAEIVDYSDIAFGESLPSPSWISYLPKEGIAASIPPFQEFLDKQKEQEAFAKCCTLYVAMTRAARALYIISSCGKTTTTLAPDMLMKEVYSRYGSQSCDREWFKELYHACKADCKMSLIYSRGDNNFVEKEFSEKPENSVKLLPAIPRKTTAMTGKIKQTASGQKSLPTPDVSKRFHRSSGASIGTIVHELFEKIEFIDDNFCAEKFCNWHLKDTPFSDPARKIFCNALVPGNNITALLSRPSGDFELWNEYRFILKNSENIIIPGAFDRVIIHKENGTPSSAEIIDYKTDNLEKIEDFSIYTEQMITYKRSLSSITGLPETQIKCIICSLHLDQTLTI